MNTFLYRSGDGATKEDLMVARIKEITAAPDSVIREAIKVIIYLLLTYRLKTWQT